LLLLDDPDDTTAFAIPLELPVRYRLFLSTERSQPAHQKTLAPKYARAAG
jgi:hypothetical protein